MTALLLAVGAVAVAGAVANLVLMIRWRRRHRDELAAAGHDLRRVHRLVGSGGPVAEADRTAAVIDVEMHVMTLPNITSMLLLAGSIALDGDVTSAAATVRYTIGGIAVAFALAGMVMIVRYLRTAGRQGIRPRRLWT